MMHSNHHDEDENDRSWSIYDLNNAPEPPRRSSTGVGAPASLLVLSPRIAEGSGISSGSSSKHHPHLLHTIHKQNRRSSANASGGPLTPTTFRDRTWTVPPSTSSIGNNLRLHVASGGGPLSAVALASSPDATGGTAAMLPTGIMALQPRRMSFPQQGQTSTVDSTSSRGNIHTKDTPKTSNKVGNSSNKNSNKTFKQRIGSEPLSPRPLPRRRRSNSSDSGASSHRHYLQRRKLASLPALGLPQQQPISPSSLEATSLSPSCKEKETLTQRQDESFSPPSPPRQGYDALVRLAALHRKPSSLSSASDQGGRPTPTAATGTNNNNNKASVTEPPAADDAASLSNSNSHSDSLLLLPNTSSYNNLPEDPPGSIDNNMMFKEEKESNDDYYYYYGYGDTNNAAADWQGHKKDHDIGGGGYDDEEQQGYNQDYHNDYAPPQDLDESAADHHGVLSRSFHRLDMEEMAHDSEHSDSPMGYGEISSSSRAFQDGVDEQEETNQTIAPMPVGSRQKLPTIPSSKTLLVTAADQQQQGALMVKGTEEEEEHYPEYGDETDCDEENDSSTSSQAGVGRHRQAPGWWERHRPFTLHQVASCLVVYAPCFWVWHCGSCFSAGSGNPSNKHVLTIRRQPTDRAILSRLNFLLTFFSVAQIGSALFFSIVTLASKLVDRHIPSLSNAEIEAQSSDRWGDNIVIWNVSINVNMIGIEAFVLVVTALLTVRVVRTVNLVGAIRYLWVLLWILPFEIYFNIGLYDYFRVTDVWVRHYWRDDTMAWFREKFCDPPSTANDECTVPIGVNETDWCLVHYNSTSCAAIRDNAQSRTETWLLFYYYFNASWGLVLISLLVLVVKTLERIISRPLVQKSRQSNVAAWMSLPTVCCLLFGLIFTLATTSGLSSRAETDTEANWIGPLYLATAGLFFFSALLGWFISVSSITNARHKRNKMICINAFVVLMALIGGSLIALFAASVTFSSSFVKVPLTQSQRGDLACFIDSAGGCSLCDLPAGNARRCPEWTVDDVTKVIQTQAKSSAALAAILMLYAFSAFRFGLGMRKNIRMYQIEYV